MTDMLEKVKNTIIEHNLLSQGDKVLVALSGGADSVCLLHCMLELAPAFNLSVSAAHVNHGLRGQDADNDEVFVRAFCVERGISLYVHKADVASIAKQRNMGLEEAGRYVRYHFFDALQKEHGFNKIATAHHAGDNVETVLMRLMRGTGLKGLGGIPHQNKTVIRPLLDRTRKEIEAYLETQNLSYRTDFSNYETTFTRNRVRHELLPFIEEKFNANFIQLFQEQIGLYSACGAYINEEVEKLFKCTASAAPEGFGFDCRSFLDKNEFLVGAMLHQVMVRVAGGQEISRQHTRAVMDIVKAQSGAVSLPGEALAEVCHGILYIRKKVDVKAFTYTLDSVVDIKESGCRITVSEVACLPKQHDKQTAYLDFDKLKGKRLLLRSRVDGDVFYPVGMEGKKKLQDFFIDQKVPYFMRDTVPILTADNAVVWVSGYRCDRRFAATDETRTVLCVKIHRGELR